MNREIGYYVASDAVEHWPVVAALVAQVLPKMQGEMVLSDFVDGFAEERLHLFVGYVDGEAKTCMITAFVEYPQYKILRVLIAAGSGFGSFMKTFMDYIKNWAKVNGAQSVEAYTTPAMTRYHRRFGAQKVYDVIRFSLEE